MTAPADAERAVEFGGGHSRDRSRLLNERFSTTDVFNLTRLDQRDVRRFRPTKGLRSR